ncbi:MAG TPA: DUF1080 domain-containing protein [Gemmataceae bacterium]|nr:DUF1080 domain-containing protein [Gemmataceae bacterium]
MRLTLLCSMLFATLIAILSAGSRADEPRPPKGFTALFDGKTLAGWHGMPHFDPYKLNAMPEDKRKALIDQWTADAKKHWTVENGELINDGNGAYLTTDKEYGDIELLIEYKTVPKADSGIYLRATPQVQIWDTTKEGGKWSIGADKGSGGLWNNTPGTPGRDPLVHADRPFGEWNTFRILMVGELVTVYLNGKLVVDHARLENFWNPGEIGRLQSELKRAEASNAVKSAKKAEDLRRKIEHVRTRPLPLKEVIQLQTHGGEIRWRNIYIREIPSDEANTILAKHNTKGYESVFNDKDFTGWAGPVDQYQVKDGAIVCRPGKGGTIYTKGEYSDFMARLEFKLPPGGNNGLAIRYPGNGDTAYVGMCELQVLDDTAPQYAKLDPRQYHGSAYGMVPAHRGYQRPVGDWNFQEVTIKGPTIKVELNGTIILDCDLSKVTKYMANSPHPGKERATGHFGFAGHNDPVAFRKIQIKRLDSR